MAPEERYDIIAPFSISRCAVEKVILLTVAQDKPQVSSNVDSRVVKSQKTSVATTDEEQGLSFPASLM